MPFASCTSSFGGLATAVEPGQRPPMDETNRFFQAVTFSDVVLRVSDLPRMRAFYRDLLGLTVVSEDAKHVSVSADGALPALLTLVLSPDSPPRPRGSSGFFHVAFLFPDRASLGRSAQNLVERSVHLATGDHGVSEALYLDDPEGNGVELYTDRPASAWPKATSSGDALGMYTEAVDLTSLAREGDPTRCGA